ncbi:succinoglycan biosynthesis protein ExoO [Caldovatus sediminis]|uniref:Succinoglycan biosynthesis protein ExoO n=1 Tax=Caldovatus sediminis TaxID=2041189 RepID=A0A8J2Z8E4_9PROT|nr:glycosyltransferase family 2 protein [Caldovatus sediminis]GGG20388.1 succinoglycan biosynthesis protein ExoO [Caldovatus sediminis]
MTHAAAPGRGQAPAASVVIAAHEAAAFVQDAIRSALGQTRRDIEVVAVDDGSTDGTWGAILDCARGDARVLPLRQPRRAGPSAARNLAIRHARGRWLAVLDADDLFLPERLERMIAEAEARGADLLADNLLETDFVTGKPLGRRFTDAEMRHDGPVPLIEAVRRDMPGTACRGRFGFLQPIIRRDFLRRHGLRYAEDLQAGEDFLLYFECLAHGGRFHLTPEAHYVYRLRAGSVSTRRSATLCLSAANRRMLRIAAALGDGELLALLRRRQRLIDFDSFALLAERGYFGAALRYLHCTGPASLLRHARVALGAARRRLGARASRGAPGVSTAARG